MSIRLRSEQSLRSVAHRAHGLGRRLATGNGTELSADERCLLALIDDPSRDDPRFRGPNADIAALETRICAACSARIMLRLVLGRPDPLIAGDPQ